VHQPGQRVHLTRRGVLTLSGAGLLAAGGLAFGADRVVSDLIGTAKTEVDNLTGEGGPGANVSGTFYSHYRNREVGYTVGYPAGFSTHASLPLTVFFHGFRGTHEHCLAGYSPSSAVSVKVDGRRLTPMALVTVDGGNGYWHPHPGDDPMGMVMHELIPMMRARGLGGDKGTATMGISMGGYGALAFAEHYPTAFRAVAAISPAIFVTYQWVHYVNPGAYWSAQDFARYDAVTHAAALRDIPVRVASGAQDPFHPWVVEFAERLPRTDPVVYPPGAHTGSFFYSQIVPSVAFLSAHLREA
jgi:pimeloyl-ACP methyl ester carboxylesterase